VNRTDALKILAEQEILWPLAPFDQLVYRATHVLMRYGLVKRAYPLRNGRECVECGKKTLWETADPFLLCLPCLAKEELHNK